MDFYQEEWFGITIDLHTYRVDEAVQVFVEAYNGQAAQKYPQDILVIHGYGSSGNGGKIRAQVRALLKSNNVEFQTGEKVWGNPGVTLVYPHDPLPTQLDQLSELILDWCKAPKSLEKLANKFRRFGVITVRDTVAEMERNGQLEQVVKNGIKHYKTV